MLHYVIYSYMCLSGATNVRENLNKSLTRNFIIIFYDKFQNSLFFLTVYIFIYRH